MRPEHVAEVAAFLEQSKAADVPPGPRAEGPQRT